MFIPKYTISNKILFNVRSIGEIIGELNSKYFASNVKAKLEKQARELSVYASVSIEGNPLSLTETKKILKNHPKYIRDSQKEILNYNEALSFLSDVVQRGKFVVSDDNICKIQNEVIKGLITNSADIGKYRKSPVVVRDIREQNKIAYLAPNHQDVNNLMDEIIKFVNQKEGILDSLIIAGIFHKQFLIIHPFIDGNGRTVRLVTTALLAKLGLNMFKLFSFENYYNSNITKYFEKVGVRGDYYDLVKIGIDFTEWLEYFTDGIVDELERLKKTLPQNNQIRLESYHKLILSFLQENGSIRANEYEKLTDRKRATRKKDFQKLVKAKLIKRKGQGRGVYYVLS